MSKLNDREERFCLEYIIDFHGTNSAVRAGYSPKTATSKASQLLTKVNIQNRLKELQQKAIDKLNTTHTDVLNQLKNWAYSDITETIGLTSEEVKQLPLGVRQLITKYKQTNKKFEGGSEEIIELSFVSKEKAIEMIARHIGFFEVDNKQKESNSQMVIFELPSNGRD